MIAVVVVWRGADWYEAIGHFAMIMSKKSAVRCFCCARQAERSQTSQHRRETAQRAALDPSISNRETRQPIWSVRSSKAASMLSSSYRVTGGHRTTVHLHAFEQARILCDTYSVTRRHGFWGTLAVERAGSWTVSY